MKLWEVIKSLDENPKRTYEIKERSKRWVLSTDYEWAYPSDELYYNLDCLDNNEKLITHDGGRFSGNITVNGDDWQEVKQPVTWQEAIQAWADGRKVSLEGEQFVGIVFTEDITNGTWYIED